MAAQLFLILLLPKSLSSDKQTKIDIIFITKDRGYKIVTYESFVSCEKWIFDLIQHDEKTNTSHIAGYVVAGYICNS